jgi:hypothetical protein
MFRSLIQLIFGILTFIPGVYKWRAARLGSGGSYSSEYCYTVWMRHIVYAQQSDLECYPNVVAELGPGDTLGVGIMALLLGSSKYIAYDVVEFSNSEKNLIILEDLLAMLKERKPIPNDQDFPRVIPKLVDYAFPSNIYSEDYLKKTLSADRVDKIRLSLSNQNSMIEYNLSWLKDSKADAKKIDIFISQAVLEHVDDLEGIYALQNQCLSNDGYISHAIDFKSHGYSSTWDGHWGISNWRWFLLRGNRPYMINREPLSKHLSILSQNNFNLIKIKNYLKEPALSSKRLIKKISESDKNISDSFIQAKLNK